MPHTEVESTKSKITPSPVLNNTSVAESREIWIISWRR